ncbi:hypothetical protein Acr_17g0013880 [Actinidia rufa]|uniref:Uncharacterized protein n=1 Tax=Actinidia rufa TaxID=165716 RepID=A0A7J0G4W7_9ERIC|nr:hypothetical protein Acr_17g0013880 [Actinidia rufa]
MIRVVEWQVMEKHVVERQVAMELRREGTFWSQQGCKSGRGKWGLDFNSDLDDPLSQASISHKLDVEGGDGMMPPHLYVPVGVALLCLRSTTCVHSDAFEERARFQECKATIQALNNKQASKKLLVLHIEGQTPLRNKFSLEDFNAELNENALLAQDPSWNEDITSSSSSYVSSDSSNNKEEGKEVNQLILNRRRRGAIPIATPKVLAAEPILVSSLKLEDSDDLAFIPL